MPKKKSKRKLVHASNLPSPTTSKCPFQTHIFKDKEKFLDIEEGEIVESSDHESITEDIHPVKTSNQLAEHLVSVETSAQETEHLISVETSNYPADNPLSPKTSIHPAENLLSVETCNKTVENLLSVETCDNTTENLLSVEASNHPTDYLFSVESVNQPEENTYSVETLVLPEYLCSVETSSHPVQDQFLFETSNQQAKQILSAETSIQPEEDLLLVETSSHSTEDLPTVENSSQLDEDVQHDGSEELPLHDNKHKFQGAKSANESHTPSSSSVAVPPLAMQTSSQFNEDGLDIQHGGGGENSSDDGRPVRKRLKLMEDSEEDASQCSSSSKTCDASEITFEDCYSKAKFNASQSKLEFDILDEFESNEEEDEEGEPVNESSDSEDISDDEIYAMLDESLNAQKLPSAKISTTNFNDSELEHVERKRVLLKVKRRDHFDVLPEGWVEITHNSGMPVYLHRQSRVCCMSKPYFLGTGSARKHDIPISAIPCLNYAKILEKERLEKEQQEKEETKNTDSGSDSNAGIVIPSARIECIEESKKEGSLDFMAVRDYCQKLFEFETITIKRFKTWVGKRKYHKMLKQSQKRPTLPENTKLITCPLPVTDEKGQGAGNATKREFILNPSGKSAICILHEYVQHISKVQPHYVFKELENANTPYGAVVVINNVEYGFGFGSSKKQAKSEAAKSALEILIPKIHLFNSNSGEKEKDLQDVQFFDEVRIEDPRVCELSVKAGQPYPYQILLECLKRNYGMGNTDIQFSMRCLKHQKNEFTIAVGKHTASVVCKNKREGKQRASQAILQLLHPKIVSWGSLLRMYGIGSRQTLKEKKIEEQRITELQSKACANKPNLSILNKLKAEMLKYRKMKESMKPIGKLIPEEMQFLSTSDSNLKNVEL